jgi:uncharacterized membrane protein
MNKEQFLNTLREKLSSLSAEDLAERLAFYREAIDDRLEDGLTEQEAVEQLGAVDEITVRIIGDIPSAVTAKEKHRVNPWVVVLLVLGSPLWISLLLTAFSVVISVYATVWSGVITLWLVDVSIVSIAVASLAGSILLFVKGNIAGGFAAVACLLFCAGLSILGFYGCLYTTKGTAWLTGKSFLWIVGLFKRKERAQ